MTERTASAIVWWLVALALVLRAIAAFAFTKHISGDELWYIPAAQAFVREGFDFEYPDQFARSPGVVWIVGALFRLFGTDALAPVRVLNCLLLSLTPWLVWRIGRQLFARTLWVGVAAAAVEAVNPYGIQLASEVMSEPYYLPLTLFFVGWVLEAARREAHAWRRALAAGICGGVLLHVRGDFLSLVLAAPTFAYLQRAWVQRQWRRSAGRWAVTVATALTLCVPYSAYVSSRLGKRVLIGSPTDLVYFQEHRGYIAWLTSLDVQRQVWLALLWWGPHKIEPEWIPREALRSDAEADRAAELVAAATSRSSSVEQVDRGFATLADAEIRARPLRYFVLLPAARTALIWLDVLDTDTVKPIQPTSRSPVSWTLRIGEIAYNIVCGAGFLAALVTSFRVRREQAVLGLLIVVRTVSLTFGGVLLWGHALFEARYLTPVQPLAVLLAVAAVAEAGARVRRRTTSDSGDRTARGLVHRGSTGSASR